MKDKLVSMLGGAGVVIYYIVTVVVSALPALFITGSWFWRVVIFLVQSLYPPASGVFWIWGLIKAITGRQDIFAYIYYVVSVVVFLPYFIGTIIDFVSSIKGR